MTTLALSLLAEAEKAAAKPPFFANPMFMLIILGVMFIFLIILPGRAQKKRQAEMLAGLKKGDRVSTNGGIIGTIQSVTQKEGQPAEVVLSTGLDGRGTLTVARQAVVIVLSNPEGGAG